MKKAFNIMIKIVTAFGIILIFLLLFSPEVNYAGASAHRISCSQNIIQLELALRMYQNHYNGLSPSISGDKRLEVLLIEQYIKNKLVF